MQATAICGASMSSARSWSDYNGQLQQDLAKSVWATAGASWYKLADGTITNNWPHSTIRYKRLLREAQLEDYDT